MTKIPSSRRRFLETTLISLLTTLLGISLIVLGTLVSIEGMSTRTHHKVMADAFNRVIVGAGGFLLVFGFFVILLAWARQRSKD